MALEKVSCKMVLENIKYVNANNAIIHTENLVTGIWAKFRLGTGIWYPPFTTLNLYVAEISAISSSKIIKES